MEPKRDRDLAALDLVANLMDNALRVPFTNFRFGLDALLGLVPGVGDFAGLAVGGALVVVMVRRGAGPILMLKMLGNILLDALVGAIPVLGDWFDFGFKANRRNVDLLKKYYAEEGAKPRAGVSALLLAAVFLALLVLIGWGIWRLSTLAFQAIFG